MYLGKEYTEEQIDKMDCNDVNTLLDRYESVLSAEMTKSLGKSVINLHPFLVKCREPSHGSRTGIMAEHVIASHQP